MALHPQTGLPFLHSIEENFAIITAAQDART